MSTNDSVRPGDTLGPYELLACVGRGGMAAVWAARHRGAHGFSKIVAIKTMLPEISDEADFQRMFLSEARVAARIRHPNVVETLDLGEEEGLLYIVMEWLDCEALSSILKAAKRQGRVPLPIALKIVVDACAGAHAAHELCDDENRPLGLVHRDVSPPNVLVSYSGVVKLADFGVAKTMERGSDGVTQAGQIKGKLRYMAPEQMRGDPLDRRADVFALGVSLYQLTTGRHPWPGESATVMIRKVLSEEPAPPTSFVENYPAELERIVLKALAKDPTERFQTAAELALALETFARADNLGATMRELGAYVEDLLGHKGKGRREALRVATREADTCQLGDGWAEGPSGDGQSPQPERESTTPPTGDAKSLRPLSLSSRGPASVEPEVERRDRAIRGLLLAAAAIFVAAGAYSLGGRRSGDVVAAAAIEHSAVAATAASIAAPAASASPTGSAPVADAVTASPKGVLREPIRPTTTVHAPRRPAAGAPTATQTPERARQEESDPDVGF